MLPCGECWPASWRQGSPFWSESSYPFRAMLVSLLARASLSVIGTTRHARWVWKLDTVDFADSALAVVAYSHTELPLRCSTTRTELPGDKP